MALQQDRKTAQKSDRFVVVPVAGATRIFAGSIVALTAAEHAVPAGTSGATRVLGVAGEHVDNRDGEAGDKKLLVIRGVFGFTPSPGTTGPFYGSPAYAVDDGTVTVAIDGEPPVGALPAGIVVDAEDDELWVDFSAAAVAAAQTAST